LWMLHLSLPKRTAWSSFCPKTSMPIVACASHILQRPLCRFSIRSWRQASSENFYNFMCMCIHLLLWFSQRFLPKWIRGRMNESSACDVCPNVTAYCSLSHHFLPSDSPYSPILFPTHGTRVPNSMK
jgi:hypothetical protein